MIYIFALRYADNNSVSTAAWATAATFLILLFPVHINNYIYFDSRRRKGGLTVALYGRLPVLKVNTVEHSLTKMQINGRDKPLDSGFIKSNALKIFNNLSVTKVIQLGDYGMLKDGPAYAAVAQHAAAQALYSFIALNGGKAKLSNYMILNREHGDVAWCAKICGVINLLAVLKIIFIMITEKLNEQA